MPSLSKLCEAECWRGGQPPRHEDQPGCTPPDISAARLLKASREAARRLPSSIGNRGSSESPSRVPAGTFRPPANGVPRMPQPADGRCRRQPRGRDSTEFFLTQHLAVDAARVDRDAKALCDSFGQMRTGDVRIGRAELRNEIHQFRRQFVPGAWPAFLRQQAGESGLSKGCLCLIERGPREAECFRGLTDWLLVDIDQSQHFVLDLQQVFSVEELALLEALVCDI